MLYMCCYIVPIKSPMVYRKEAKVRHAMSMTLNRSAAATR